MSNGIAVSLKYSNFDWLICRRFMKRMRESTPKEKKDEEEEKKKLKGNEIKSKLGNPLRISQNHRFN